MDRDPRELDPPRDPMTSTATTRADDRLVPRDIELERYQISQDRAQFDRDRRQEEYDRFRREQERVREEEEQQRLRQELVHKDWVRIAREQDYGRQQQVIRVGEEFDRPRIPEEQLHTPAGPEQPPQEDQQQALELLTQQPQHVVELAVPQQMLVDGGPVYQELRRVEDQKIEVNGDMIVVSDAQVIGTAEIQASQLIEMPGRLGEEGEVVPEEQKFNTTTLPPVVNLKKPVFFEELHEFFATAKHTDTRIICKDGERRAHSIVLGAASSLFRFMFAEIAEKILDADYIICLPEYTLQDLDELLKPVYGFSQQTEQQTVQTNALGFPIDFNEGGIYEAKVRAAQREKAVREKYDRLIPYDEIKQEKKGKKSKHGYNYDSFVESSSDEDYKPRRTKHGYKYDSFVEDSSTSESDDDFDEEDFLDDSKPKKRGRKKGSKNTRKYTKRIKSEPLICVKEEAIDKTVDEFDETFLQKTQVTRNAEIKFAQDHIGFYHCQEEGCSFKTMVRPSVHQHHKFSHQNLHGYQEALLGCMSCGESWVNQIHYRKHIDSNECKRPNPVIPYVCENCGQGWYNLTNYTKHAEARECKTNTSHIGKKPCSNSACPLTFFSDTNRETHENRAHKPITAGTMYRCAKCNINFINHKDYNKHKKDVHNEKPRGGYVVYVCKVTGCEYSNPERKVFETHVREDHPDECFLCDLCGRNFSDAYKLEQHKENNPNGRGGKRCLPVNYNCPHCPREFNRKRHMELHVLFKHTQERPFGCDQCGKRFKTRQCVRLHMRSHGIGGYGGCCEECGKTFNQISAYHTHLKVHSNVRDFACEDCGMTFKLKHSLKKHQLVHKPEFGHTCDFCGKKFKRSDNLINHRRRHTGEHPYKCDKCNWTGPDSSSFIHHKKKHADVVHNTQELKLIHAISKLPEHLLNRDAMNGRDNHSDIM